MLKYFFKLHYVRKASVVILFIVMFMSGLIMVGAPLLKKGLIVDMPLQHADALIVMAGSQSERLPVAADLYKRGMAPRILLANDGVSAAFSPEKQRNLYQIEWAVEELVGFGVPREKIVKLPFYGSATMFDVLAVKKYLVQTGQEKIIVVTSDYHTRRTYWTFRHALKDSAVYISVFPAESNSVGAKGIVIEYVKLVFYVLKYGQLGLVPDAYEITLKNQ